MLNTLRTIVRRARLRKNAEPFLRKARGVVHVGANTGVEAELYAALGLNVLWIEPIPEVFAALEQNIKSFPRQRALRGLVTDQEDAEYQFNVASNHGASSSILDFADHKDIWPTISFEKTITLRSRTLEAMLRAAAIDIADYDCLILDTQGSELLVLKGASPILKHFRFIKTEVADFEAYKGCCQVGDITDFLGQYRFSEIHRNKFAERPGGGGAYYDITFAREH